MKSLQYVAYAGVLAALLLAGWSSALAQNVTYDDILHSSAQPQNWITYGGNYSSHRFSELKQIDTQNAASLKMEWVYQLRRTGIFETSPIVVDGYLYMTEPPSTVTALDVRTGKAIWRWTPELPKNLLTIGLFPTNRGVAVLGDTVYVTTIDSYLVALDGKTGAVRWRVHVAENKEGYAITSAPLAINGKIITGTGGGEAGLRGLLDAYDAKTGKRLWRLWTVPTQGEPGVETWPTRTSIAPQASRLTGACVDGPMKRLATSIARYAPAARPLTGNTPPIVDHRLLSTCSHELPTLQPITDPPTR